MCFPSSLRLPVFQEEAEEVQEEKEEEEEMEEEVDGNHDCLRMCV